MRRGNDVLNCHRLNALWLIEACARSNDIRDACSNMLAVVSSAQLKEDMGRRCGLDLGFFQSRPLDAAISVVQFQWKAIGME